MVHTKHQIQPSGECEAGEYTLVVTDLDGWSDEVVAAAAAAADNHRSRDRTQHWTLLDPYQVVISRYAAEYAAAMTKQDKREVATDVVDEVMHLPGYKDLEPKKYTRRW